MFALTKELTESFEAEKNNPHVKRYNVYSAADIYSILYDINQSFFSNSFVGRPLWFRGQSFEHYRLLPSLYRNRENKTADGLKMYSRLSLAEEYRYQNIAARVNHLIDTGPNSRVEWQEVLQHHFGKTRFMDWSESLRTALDFALEAFIDTLDNEKNAAHRAQMTPVVWVLNPYRLNEHIYDFFAEDSPKAKELIKKALTNVIYTESQREKLAKNIQEELKRHKDIYFNLGDKEASIDITIDGIVSACILDKHYHYNAEHMKNMLKSYEFNPFFFLLVRFYTDALPIEVKLDHQMILPPLASIQPYHSERIRAQRGTFTIFPNYCREEEALHIADTELDRILIESQKEISDCFCQLRLCDPNRITRDLICAGERRPELYPDIQIYADYLEAQKFHI